MAVDDLVVRAAIRDEMSRPLHEITGELERLRREARRTNDQMNQLGGAAARASSSLQRTASGTGMVGSALSAVGTAASAAVRWLGLATAAGAAFGLTTAANIESANIAFTTLLGSASAATGYMGQLRDLALATPFSLPELASGAQKLLAMGYSADLAKQALVAAGDAAASMGSGAAGVDRITLAMGQMMATGRVMGQEVMQLNQAGINAFQIIADATGKTVMQVRKESMAGLLDAQTNVPIILAGIEQKVGGAMEAQGKTLRGTWNRLTENLGLSLADAIQPSEDKIKQIMEGIIKATTPFAKAVAQVGVAMLPALDALIKVMVPLSPLVGDLAVVIGGELATAITTLAPSLPVLAQSFVDIFKALQPLIPELAGSLSDAVIQLAPKLPDIADAFVGIADALLKLTPLIIPIAGILGDIAGTTGGAWALVGVWGAYKGVMGLVNLQLLIAKNRLKLVNFWNTVTASSTAIYAGVLWAEAGAAYAAARANGSGVIAAMAWALWSGIATVATEAWAFAAWTLAIPIIGIEAPIWAVVLVVAALVAGIWLAWKHFGWFRDAVHWVWDQMTGFWGWITGINFGGILSGIADMAVTAWNFLLDKINVVIDALKTAWDWLTKVWNKIKGWLGLSASGDNSSATATGDTATSRGSGGGLGNTLAMHGALMGTNKRIGISNALIGGGGMGRGSGDHQAGRALDLVGSGLNSYAQQLREMGGYAAFHGSGGGRHLHAVYPSGDTTRSHARPPAPRGGGQAHGGDTIVIGEGALTIYADAGTDVEAQALRALQTWTRDRAERR